MSLLLHVLEKVLVFSVLGVAVLTFLMWFTKSTRSSQAPPSESGEWPEDKEIYVNRRSVTRPASSRRDSKGEQERRRA